MISGWSPFALSLWVASLAGGLAWLIGSSLGWCLAKKQFRGKLLLEWLTLLPLILPPTVLGYYLLLLLGQRGIGPLLERFGLRVIFAWPGAVIAATVAAIPLVVQAARAAFALIDSTIEDAARVDGAGEWAVLRYVSIPLAWRGILAGAILGFLRALGDFGATLMVAGNIPGRTQTLSLAIYDAVQSNATAQATSLVLILSTIAWLLLVIVLWLSRN